MYITHDHSGETILSSRSLRRRISRSRYKIIHAVPVLRVPLPPPLSLAYRSPRIRFRAVGNDRIFCCAQIQAKHDRPDFPSHSSSEPLRPRPERPTDIKASVGLSTYSCGSDAHLNVISGAARNAPNVTDTRRDTFRSSKKAATRLSRRSLAVKIESTRAQD